MKSAILKKPLKHEWHEILTVLIHKHTPVRTISTFFIILSWVLAISVGKLIGMNNASLGIAFKYGMLPYLTLFIILIFISHMINRRLNTELQELYTSKEIKQFLNDEDVVINLETLNSFSAGAMAIFAGRYVRNKFEKSGESRNSSKETSAKLFLLFFMIIFHWWYIYMSPRGLAEIVYEIKFHGFSSSLRRAFVVTYPWLIITYLTVVSSASLFGALTIDFTK